LPRPTWLPDGRSWVNSSSIGSFGLITTASGNLISCNNPSDKTGTVKTPSEVAADFTSTPLELKINNQGENLIFGEAIQQKDITT
jgi:hypothetical protein